MNNKYIEDDNKPYESRLCLGVTFMLLGMIQAAGHDIDVEFKYGDYYFIKPTEEIMELVVSVKKKEDESYVV